MRVTWKLTLPVLLLGIWFVLPATVIRSDEYTISKDTGEDVRSHSKANLSREPDVVGLDGAKIPGVCGQAVEAIRMVTFRNNQFHAIPIQIDERNTEGKLVYPHGTKATKDEDPRFDGNDLLLFVAHDLEDQASSERIADLGPLVEEIEVRDPIDGSKAWGYAVSNQGTPAVSETDYVRYSYVEGKVDSVDAQHYSICYPWGEYYTDTLSVPHSSGGNGVNFIDRLKARGHFKFLFSLVSVRITEDKMSSKVSAYIDGPIRVIRHITYWANIGFGIRSTSFEADLTYYPCFMQAPLTMRVPVKMDLFLSEAYADIGSDYNHHAYGMVFTNSNNADGTIIDGRMSPQEKALDLSMDEWRMVTGPQGTLLRGRMPQCELTRQIKISVHYVDDYRSADPPEQEPGMIGHVFDRGDILHLRPGVYETDLLLFIPPYSRDGKHERYLNMEKAPLETLTRTLHLDQAYPDRFK